MNKVFLKGRLGKDWEIKELGENKVANTSLATSEKYKGEDITMWHRLKAWNKIAETLTKHTGKGDELLLEGEIQYSNWVDKEGNKRTSTEIKVNWVDFSGNKSKVNNSFPIAEKAEPISKSVDDLPF